MRLRTKLLLAQLPLAIAIVFLGIAASRSISSLAEKTELVLRDNYRSVLAAERMKEALERIDGGAASWILGRRELAQDLIMTNQKRFETQLGIDEANVTESGEAAAGRRLRAAWKDYLDKLAAFQRLPDGALVESYFAAVQPQFEVVKAGADEILTINQDAMVRKSDEAADSAARARSALWIVSILALIAGAATSMLLTSRLLRPLSVLGQAVRRLGEGDLVVRAQVQGKDEIGQLAKDFNAMAGHLEQYRKSSLGELLVAQSAAQAVIESLPDPVVVIGVRGELLNVNRAAERILGIEIESGRGLAAAATEVRELIRRVTAEVMTGAGPYVPKGLDEAVRFSSEAGELQLLPRATPIYNDEGIIDGTTVVLQDVTRLMRFDELKNNLVATVAHEFRTPLTSLRMAIHMCVEGAVGELNEKQKDLLYVGREDCERLQGIVDELLDMSRIQSGKIDVQRRRVEADALVHEAVDTHAAAAKLAHLTLRSETMPGIGAVDADPDRVQLVFDNLITNALRHTREGEVVVRALPADGAVRFEVADTGAGIPPEHQASMFEKFYRVPGVPAGGGGAGSVHREADRRSPRRPDRLHKRSGQGHDLLVHTHECPGIDRR